MRAKLIAYDLKRLKQIDKVLVKRLLFGYTQYSNYGRYKHKKEGILEKIPHIKIARAVVIVENKNKKKITNVLEKVMASYKVFNVDIKEAELKAKNKF
ncbi:MAG: hypothetical protein KKE23_03825 [Nanoarchaeota archaeon]|nr:hypothetical protein [Nanoarchaeota archaeon]